MSSPAAANPFSPTFGTTPPLLAGRDRVLARFDNALNAGPTHPDYTLLITGERGTGTTALLNVLEARAIEREWHVITAAASGQRLSARIAGEAQRCINVLRGGGRLRLASVSALGVGVSVQQPTQTPSPEPGLLSVLEELGDLLVERDSGLLLTIDELHDIERDEVQNVASALQIVTRRRLRPIALAAAALPLVEDTHLADAHMTFLQRCARARLGPLDEAATRQALQQPIVNGDSTIDPGALDEAVAATLGYPYMIQLVGFHAWDMRADPAQPISLTNVRAGAAEAEHIMVDQIAGPIWNRLSTMDRRFLIAMLEDELDSDVTEIAGRLGRSAQHARGYRRRLISAGAISVSDRGRVRFCHHAIRSRAQTAARDG